MFFESGVSFFGKSWALTVPQWWKQPDIAIEKANWAKELTKDPDISLNTVSHLVFDKGNKNAHWGKDNLFKKKKKDAGEIGYLPVED